MQGKPTVNAATEIRGDWDRSGNARYTLVGVKEVDAPTARFFKEAATRLATYEAALREIATWHCSGYAITSQLSQEEIIALMRDFYRRADECRDIARKALEAK